MGAGGDVSAFSVTWMFSPNVLCLGLGLGVSRSIPAHIYIYMHNGTGEHAYLSNVKYLQGNCVNWPVVDTHLRSVSNDVRKLSSQPALPLMSALLWGLIGAGDVLLWKGKGKSRGTSSDWDNSDVPEWSGGGQWPANLTASCLCRTSSSLDNGRRFKVWRSCCGAIGSPSTESLFRDFKKEGLFFGPCFSSSSSEKSKSLIWLFDLLALNASDLFLLDLRRLPKKSVANGKCYKWCDIYIYICLYSIYIAY